MAGIMQTGIQALGGDETTAKIASNVGLQEKLISGLLNSVNVKAKAVLAKGIDYTLLVVLLGMQYMRCGPPTELDIDEINADKENVTSTIVSGLTSMCDSAQYESINIEVWSVTAFCLLYGIITSTFVVFHAAIKFKKLTEFNSTVEMLYWCTDKFLIFDSILEIPISFAFAPYVTVFLWTIYSGIVFCLYFLTLEYEKKLNSSEGGLTKLNYSKCSGDIFINMGEDSDNFKNSQMVFITSCVLVGMSLLKLTGEISQYWVMYKAASSPDSKAKVEALDKKSARKKNKIYSA